MLRSLSNLGAMTRPRNSLAPRIHLRTGRPQAVLLGAEVVGVALARAVVVVVKDEVVMQIPFAVGEAQTLAVALQLSSIVAVAA